MIDVLRRVELGKVVDDYYKTSLTEAKTVEEKIFICERWAKRLDQQEPELQQEEMTDARARVFEKQVMPFGKFEGWPIEQINTDYLCNLFDPDPFMKKLRLYLKWRLKNER